MGAGLKQQVSTFHYTNIRELRFTALLTDGAPGVRFEGVAAGKPR